MDEKERTMGILSKEERVQTESRIQNSLLFRMGYPTWRSRKFFRSKKGGGGIHDPVQSDIYHRYKTRVFFMWKVGKSIGQGQVQKDVYGCQP